MSHYSDLFQEITMTKPPKLGLNPKNVWLLTRIKPQGSLPRATLLTLKVLCTLLVVQYIHVICNSKHYRSNHASSGYLKEDLASTV